MSVLHPAEFVLFFLPLPVLVGRIFSKFTLCRFLLVDNSIHCACILGSLAQFFAVDNLFCGERVLCFSACAKLGCTHLNESTLFVFSVSE